MNRNKTCPNTITVKLRTKHFPVYISSLYNSEWFRLAFYSM